MRILLLEDNISLNKAIRKSLQIDQHDVTCFYDGNEVFEKIDKKYDLYILDINVPNINGLELLDMIYTNDNSSKVMIISSNIDLKSIKDAYKLGCIDYLRKPFHLEELRLKIKKLNTDLSSVLDTIEIKKDMQLTKKEKELLLLLLDNRNRLVSYRMIEDVLYPDKMMSMDGLRALIKRLRSKLKEDIVQNVIDEGYTVVIH